MPQDRDEQRYFDHFGSTKVTWLGRCLTRTVCNTVWRLARFQPGQSVLEIGPGRGDFARRCLEQGITYHAVEANQRMALQLQQLGVEVHCQMVPPLPALDTSYDAIVLLNVLEHMNTMRDALWLVSQIRSQLRPQGRLFICCPDYLNWRGNFFNCDFSHNYVVTQRRLQQLLLNAGFARSESTYVSGPFRGLTALGFSSLVPLLPFSTLHAWFPRSKLIARLYTLKLGLLRKVVTVGHADE